jgi:hypothetical protein
MNKKKKKRYDPEVQKTKVFNQEDGTGGGAPDHTRRVKDCAKIALTY